MENETACRQEDCNVQKEPATFDRTRLEFGRCVEFTTKVWRLRLHFESYLVIEIVTVSQFDSAILSAFIETLFRRRDVSLHDMLAN